MKPEYDLLIIDDPLCPDMDDPVVRAKVMHWYETVLPLSKGITIWRGPFHKDSLFDRLMPPTDVGGEP